MNNHRRLPPLIIAAVVALISVFAWASIASAQTLIDGRTTCATIGFRFIGPGHVDATASSVTVPFNLPAGSYRMVQYASDGYDGRQGIDEAVNAASQSSEVFENLGYRSDDLADGVESASTETSHLVEITEALTELTTVHRPESAWRIDSVDVDRVCFTELLVEHAPVFIPESVPEPELTPIPDVVPEPELVPEVAPEPELVPVVPEVVPAPEPTTGIDEPVAIERPHLHPEPEPAPVGWPVIIRIHRDCYEGH